MLPSGLESGSKLISSPTHLLGPLAGLYCNVPLSDKKCPLVRQKYPLVRQMSPYPTNVLLTYRRRAIGARRALKQRVFSKTK